MRASGPFRTRPVDCEWIGGRYTLPDPVRENGALVHQMVDLWLELPRGVLVAITLIDPREPIPFGVSLRQTMQQPVEGSARTPARIRVAEERLAADVRNVLGSETSVIVGPVPELDAAFEEFIEAIADDEPPPSYLGDGTIRPDVVERLFAAASLFFRAAPWTKVDESQVLQVDIPALGVDAACLCIIGGAGESFGLLLYRSYATYVAFPSGPPGPATDGAEETALRSLSFSRKRKIPAAMLEEISRHRWKVAGANAYPEVMAVDSEATRRPVTERDVRILTACTRAFLAFFATHGNLFSAENREAECEVYTADDGVTVTLTAAHAAAATAKSDEERIRQLKEAHYRQWLDMPLPAFGGKTPRDAARSAKGRKALDLVLRQIENVENSGAEGERFDVASLRRELGFKE